MVLRISLDLSWIVLVLEFLLLPETPELVWVMHASAFYLILNLVTMTPLGKGSSEENVGREGADGGRN